MGLYKRITNLKKDMKLGLFDLFDQMVAEELGVDVETYIKVIESDNVSDEEQKEIIMGMVGDDVEAFQKSKELFESKLNK
jgi:hypothetical protein